MKNPFKREGKHQSRGKHEQGNPAHTARNCPQDASKADRRAGKQGLTHYTCSTCGTTWTVAPPPPIN